MRALGYGLSIALGFVLLMFFFTNQQSITVYLPWATYPNAALWKVVLLAVAVGAVFTGIFAVAEGAHTRLSNRRLRREIHKLETEINYLRTQPPVMGQAVPTSEPLVRRVTPTALPPIPVPSTGEPPSRPVYGSEEDERSPDPEDDVYTGGRAV
jgi:uncharacterized integral membrane protein